MIALYGLDELDLAPVRGDVGPLASAPAVCPFCKSSVGFGNYYGMRYVRCSADGCGLRLVFIDGTWRPDPGTGSDTARIWASNPLLSGDAAPLSRPLHRCASPDCPGLPYPASEHACEALGEMAVTTGEEVEHG